MKNVKLTKACYTLPNGSRVLQAGVYEESFFSKDELSFLKDLKVLVEVTSTEDKEVKRKPKSQTPKINLVEESKEENKETQE